MKFNKNEELGNIVAKYPAAGKIFNQYNIDYCCGGKDTLEKVCLDLSLKSDEIIKLLKTDYDNAPHSRINWIHAPYELLIGEILKEHHAFLHTNLSLISDLTKAVLRAHGQNHPELLHIFTVFHKLKSDFEIHLIKEETIQYPAIEKYVQSKNKENLRIAVNIIDELAMDHEVAGQALREIRSFSNDYSLPKDACTTYKEVYRMLELLEKNTFTHVHLENNILFKRLKSDLHI